MRPSCTRVYCKAMGMTAGKLWSPPRPYWRVGIMAGHNRAFSIAELLLIVLILGTLAAIAVPRLQLAAIKRQLADTTAKKVATDLRRTRRLAIVNAADNVAGFALNMTGGEPYTGYQIVDLDSGETVDSQDIDDDVACTGDSQFQFGPLGNLLSGSGTQLNFTFEGKTFTVTVITGTGAVRYSDD